MHRCALQALYVSLEEEGCTQSFEWALANVCPRL